MRPSIKGSTILVTGGAGFIGSHLVDSLLDMEAKEVVVIDNLFLGTEENLKNALNRGAVLYRDDAEFTTSLEYIFERHNIDIVFNCATKALNYSFMNPSNSFETNTRVVINLLELQRKKAFKTLCHFSTSEVYGTALYEPMDESHPRNPTTLYAAGKAAADLALETYVRMFDLDAFIVRPFNNYGPRQNHKGELAGVIPITVFRVLNDLPLEIHGTGEQSRDFIFITDTVDAILEVYKKLSKGESVNISTHNQITINEVITTIAEAMHYKGEILRKPSRSSDVFCHNASNDKLTELIDFNLTSFADGLNKSIQWYINEIS
ncbi:NAD-dependent epimerase/dehydratase family protein [Maridesulfovibrio hydrothermalis]|uniref:UDP-glucose 4-epimerase n=1 Tax=Maridesulfovibrio hydrothermalis AM13 = DSM 14728 TaxID=1121451 RepID=L0R8W3_9BACT|nr:NAD-dependent epimerase/dehydratase family protein [Maridesulfovibrio hydrothermalis]CCO23203.1 UDP-glucose 4-epimerase [Maridesulfovibrio hydrothermalis AM13 = DSM 14728]